MTATSSNSPSGTESLSFPRLQARTQRFTLGAPRTFTVSPDGRRILFLRSPTGQTSAHNLYRLDVETGAETCLVDAAAHTEGAEALPAEEKARRERSRTQAGGVVAYSCDRQLQLAVVTLSGMLYLVELAGEGAPAVTRLPVRGPVVDPTLDPTGRHVAYVSDGALRVYRLATGEDRLVVGRGEHEGTDVTWGLADFVAAEEMQRFRGYWWSPDGESLLATRVDAAPVTRWHIADPANPGTPPNVVPYPAAGTANAEVGLALFALDGSRVDVVWEHESYPYLARVHDSAGGSPLLEVQSRDQRTVRVLAVDTSTGATTVLAEDTDPRWVELFAGVPAWTPGGELVRVVAADGAYRLLVGDRPVTGTGLQVRSVLDIGEDDVLFTASGADPTRIHVYLADHAGTSVRAVSDVAGVSSAARGGGVTVLTQWSLERDGSRAVVLAGHPRDHAPFEVDGRAQAAPLDPRPELLTVGERGIHCALLFPRSHIPGTRLPVLLEPYGGPHAQRVLATRNAYLTPQWLADQGFAVLIADGRGTPGRGPEWDRAIHHEFAEVTLADQVAALHGVAARYPDDLDLNRVAIRGWSYGGYLSALAVLRRPDVFHAAVAGAPVTDWRLYDTHYTERYLGDPSEHPEVYDRNSLAGDAAKLSAKLLLIHGLADDNVFAAHTLRLSAALLAAGRPHEVLPLSNVTHMSPAEEETAEQFLLLQVDWVKRALGIG